MNTFNQGYNQRNYVEYIQNENWKCDKSDTGAHYWTGDIISLECKYCHEVKQLEPYIPSGYPRNKKK